MPQPNSGEATERRYIAFPFASRPKIEPVPPPAPRRPLAEGRPVGEKVTPMTPTQQEAEVNREVRSRPRVQVLDSFGAPLTNAFITFEIKGNADSSLGAPEPVNDRRIRSFAVRTDLLGEAESPAWYILGPGEHRLVAKLRRNEIEFIAATYA